MKVTWTIAPEFVPHGSRFFLGNCMASTFRVLDNDNGELFFHYKFDDCKFKKRVTLIKCSF